MRSILLLATLAAIVGPPALADEEFDKLSSEFSKTRTAWYKELHKHRNEDGSYDFKDGEMPPSPEKEFVPRFKAYAEKHAGKPEAIGALVWLANESSGGFSPDNPDRTDSVGNWAIEQLTRQHAADPSLKEHLPSLRYCFYEVGKKPLIRFYERVIDVNKDKSAAAAAMFNLAFTLRTTGPTPASAEPEMNDKDRAVKLFRRIIKDYPGTSAANRASGYVYEIEHLQIGMKAPDFSGEDVEGNTIKLSQFHGQVVVLDFWGFW